MSDLSELYQEVILDHNKRPRNFRHPEGSNHEAEGFNPLCGDHISLFLRLENGTIEDIGFQGSGCAVSKASASMMTEAMKGKSLDQAQSLFDRFRALVTGAAGAPGSDAHDARDGREHPHRDTAARVGARESTPHSPAGPDHGGSLSTGSSDSTANGSPPATPLGKLSVFSGVSEFPMRVKCATLAWHTLKAALEGKKDAVSTE